MESLNGKDKVQSRINVSPTELLRSEPLAAGIAGVDGDLTAVKLYVLLMFPGT